jgi:prolyl-tRNA synthetase
LLADEALRGRRNMICGANRNDYHLRHVTPGEDFFPAFADLRMAAEGETALDGTPLVLARGIKLARFRALRKQLLVAGESGAQTPAGVFIGRVFLDQILNAAAEQRHDADGLAFAPSIAPFAVLITPVANDEAQRDAARTLCESLCAAGFDALLDDRDERPGVKFKDGDLTGIPYRVTIGKKLAQGIVEIRDRRARTSEDVALAEAVPFLQGKLK